MTLLFTSQCTLVSKSGDKLSQTLLNRSESTPERDVTRSNAPARASRTMPLCRRTRKSRRACARWSVRCARVMSSPATCRAPPCRSAARRVPAGPSPASPCHAHLPRLTVPQPEFLSFPSSRSKREPLIKRLLPPSRASTLLPSRH
jgi:hypothetical protein